MDDPRNFDQVTLWHDPATNSFGMWVRHCTIVEAEVMELAGGSDGHSRARVVLANGDVISGHVWVIASVGNPPPAGAQEVEPEVYEEIVAAYEAEKLRTLTVLAEQAERATTERIRATVELIQKEPRP